MIKNPLLNMRQRLGVYRATHQCALVATQAADSRLFEIRNANTDAQRVIIPMQLKVTWLQTAAHTAAILDNLNLIKGTTFTAVDSANVVTPTAVALRTGGPAAPGGALLRGVTVAGAAAGMTGGTVTRSSPVARLPKWLLLAQPTGAEAKPDIVDLLKGDLAEGGHPFILGPDEGLILENGVLLGAAAGSIVSVELTWAEAVAS